MAVIVVVAVLCSFLIKTFVARSFYIPSASMEKTLMINDRVIVNELQPSLLPLTRGDVVVFKDPGGWLLGSAASTQSLTPLEAALSFVGIPSAKEDDHLIKRIIGLPGDKVACCNALGQMTVNGQAINESPYLFSPHEPASAIPFDETVPARSYWVMGDNRNDSADSRYHMGGRGGGFVPQSAIVGRALVITWPVGRWTWLDDYPAVFAAVPQSKQ
ncbi:signal peptidase I [Leifsonia sp. F6_8S_P_1B]|uniref:Signal peptidase I n=1 Tax=Leifsonia williamsii TaxID=3035919 RepID=A0ABT8KGA5_9MICO|nr:signal peptidase I [Leifsonia williamsii]MDN4615811.1 signal peptidase I [Leifsonia williamsii]